MSRLCALRLFWWKMEDVWGACGAEAAFRVVNQHRLYLVQKLHVSSYLPFAHINLKRMSAGQFGVILGTAVASGFTQLWVPNQGGHLGPGTFSRHGSPSH